MTTDIQGFALRASWRQRCALFLLLSAAALGLAPGISDSRLERHEILVAQTATEMLERNEFLLPRFMGEPRLNKPPLSYWLSIAFHRVLGKPGASKVSELEVRLPSLVSGLLLILVTYALGYYTTRAASGGLIAAALLATSALFYLFSRSGRPEMLYALLCATIALGFLIAIRRAQAGRSSIAAAALAWSAFGLALLAKGPQFPVFILLGFIVATLLQKPRLPLRKTLHPWMAMPGLALPLAYFTYLGLQVDNAVSLWRSEMVQGIDVPVLLRPLRFYYPAILVLGLAPWVVVLGLTVLDTCKRRERAALLLASCVLVSLLLVSFAGKLRQHYILPLLPLCAALMARSLLGLFDAAEPAQRRARILWCSQAFALGVLLGGYALSAVKPGVALDAPAVLAAMAGSAVLYLVGISRLLRKPRASFMPFVACVLCAWAAFSWLGIDASKSSATAYRFIHDVERLLPRHAQLYFDSGKRELSHYYYDGGWLKVKSLEQWRASKTAGPPAYFIVQSGRLGTTGIPGEVLARQQLDKDNAMVLFRPSVDLD